MARSDQKAGSLPRGRPFSFTPPANRVRYDSRVKRFTGETLTGPSSTLGSHQLKVLNQIARQATLDLELRPMLQRICDTLQRHFAWDLIALISIDHQKRRFTCEALVAKYATEARVGWGRELGSGVVGQVAASGKTILVEDADRHDGFISVMDGTRSELCVPVKHRDETVAVLNLESIKPAAFNGEVPLITTVAEQIAGAISAGRRYQALKQRAAVLEMASDLVRTATQGIELDEVMQRIAEYLVVRLGMLVAAVLMYDEKRRRLRVTVELGNTTGAVEQGGEWPSDTGVVGRCIRAGKPIHLPDVRSDPDYLELNTDVVAEYVVPIRFRDQIIGVLNLETDDPDRLNLEARTLIDHLADHVAGAIHLAKVNRDLRQMGERLAKKSKQSEALNEQLKQANAKLDQLSRQDPLTGLANRRQFDDAFATEWRRARRDSRSLACVVFDLDYFKNFNDGYGHQAGDDCLQQVAEALRDAVQREGDIVARYGGEEFAVLLSDTDASGALSWALSVCRNIAALGIPHKDSSVADHLTATAGVAALIPRTGNQPEQLVGAADAALYQAKNAGRNRVEVAGPIAPDKV